MNEGTKYEFKGNQFLDPKDCDFEILGFAEDLDDESGKFLGSRIVAEPDRVLGAAGRKEYTLTENVAVTRGHRQDVIKASPKRPKKVFGTLLIVCGRVKSKQQ